MNIEHPKKREGKKIAVIVGAGFGGLSAAKALANHPKVHVVLIDLKNYHLFQPLLYQVATAGLNASDIAVPIRGEFSKVENVEIHLGMVKSVDFQKRLILSDESGDSFSFDYLILACGAQHSYFNHPEWEDFAPGLKTLEQATEIRRRILSAFEKAENETDVVKQNALLNFVVVGGGPTGVELAGAIADVARTVLIHDFNRIDPAKAKITLLEAGPRLLASFAEDLSRYTSQSLEKMGVVVRTSSRVENINADGVQIGTEFIPAKTVLWAAGVQASPLDLQPATERDRSGRIKVTPDLSVPGFPECFVIGDMATIEIRPGTVVPGLAPAAIQQGAYVAALISKGTPKDHRKKFQYLDKGQMATIGKDKAVLQFRGLHLTGYFAWLGWLFVHLLFLVGFKNRVAVLLQWAWSYVFSKRGSRLITQRGWKLRQ